MSHHHAYVAFTGTVCGIYLFELDSLSPEYYSVSGSIRWIIYRDSYIDNHVITVAIFINWYTREIFHKSYKDFGLSEPKWLDFGLPKWLGERKCVFSSLKPSVMRLDHWIGDNLETFRTRCLDELLLPGTHDSGASELAPPDIQLEGPWWKKGPIFRMLSSLTRPLAAPWTLTQDLNLISQLHMGCRFFDLRVSAARRQENNMSRTSCRSSRQFQVAGFKGSYSDSCEARYNNTLQARQRKKCFHIPIHAHNLHNCL